MNLAGESMFLAETKIENATITITFDESSFGEAIVRISMGCAEEDVPRRLYALTKQVDNYCFTILSDKTIVAEFKLTNLACR